MKKGFTLIEMIAVVGLIGLLSLLVLPAIINQLGSKKKDISDTTKQLIISAAELYVDDNNIKESGYVTVEQLIDSGYLKKPLTDFNCGGEIPYSKEIKYTSNEYNELEFDIDLKCSE